MAGKSVGGTTKATAEITVRNSKMDRVGPSNKNLGPNRVARPGQTGTIRSLAGKAINGPDLGAGGR